MSIVINIKDKEEYEKHLLVYAGRGRKSPYMTPVGEYGWLGNPYVMVHEEDRQLVLQLHKEYLEARLRNDELFRNELRRLLERDSIFMCFCKPKLCHCDNFITWKQNDYVIVPRSH